MHETGEDGLTVKSLIRTVTDCLVEAVCGLVVVVLDVVIDDDAVVVGVEVVVEFMPYSQTKTLGDALQLVVEADRPNVKLLLDSLHLFRSGGTVADVAAVDPRYFGVIQLSDASAHAPGCYCSQY